MCRSWYATQQEQQHPSNVQMKCEGNKRRRDNFKKILLVATVFSIWKETCIYPIYIYIEIYMQNTEMWTMEWFKYVTSTKNGLTWTHETYTIYIHNVAYRINADYTQKLKITESRRQSRTNILAIWTPTKTGWDHALWKGKHILLHQRHPLHCKRT